ncbi:MAG: ABC transporter permease [Gammaproteobacteria bacterium]|nr:ABC transporter permease [Gammaproteobacteria bacterium]
MNSNSTLALNIPAPASRPQRILKLVQRRLLSFYRDKADLSITLLQAPLLALAFFVVFQGVITAGGVFGPFQPLRDYLTPDTVSILIFLTVLTAIWFGTSKAIVEIPASRVLYQQEKLSFLKNFDYIVAVFISLATIIFVQVLLFALSFHLIFIFLPAWVNPYATGLVTEPEAVVSLWTEAEAVVSLWQAFMPVLFVQLSMLLWLTAMAAITLAMFVSVFIKTRIAAVTFMTFVMIIQLLLGGSIVQPVIKMNPAIQTVADLMPSRWALEAAIVLLDKKLNLNLPRQREEDYFSFAGRKSGIIHLRKDNAEDYLEAVKQQGENVLLDTQVSVLAWHNALQTAVKNVKFNADNADNAEYAEYAASIGESVKPLSEEENRYISALPQQITDTAHAAFAAFLRQPVPERLRDEAYSQYTSILQDRADELLSKVNRDQTLTETEQEFWRAMLAADPDLALYRQSHGLHAWLMLGLLTLGGLLLAWLSFTRLNR